MHDFWLILLSEYFSIEVDINFFLHLTSFAFAPRILCNILFLKVEIALEV